mmetsp:Transcript_20333/g.63233  ORF Transcript_20333/g.63233 Transcript_20333/m.63233 type:complete len:226 (-) Transcript_20333:528-1205(-)
MARSARSCTTFTRCSSSRRRARQPCSRHRRERPRSARWQCPTRTISRTRTGRLLRSRAPSRTLLRRCARTPSTRPPWPSRTAREWRRRSAGWSRTRHMRTHTRSGSKGWPSRRLATCFTARSPRRTRCLATRTQARARLCCRLWACEIAPPPSTRRCTQRAASRARSRPTRAWHRFRTTSRLRPRASRLCCQTTAAIRMRQSPTATAVNSADRCTRSRASNDEVS